MFRMLVPVMALVAAGCSQPAATPETAAPETAAPAADAPEAAAQPAGAGDAAGFAAGTWEGAGPEGSGSDASGWSLKVVPGQPLDLVLTGYTGAIGAYVAPVTVGAASVFVTPLEAKNDAVWSQGTLYVEVRKEACVPQEGSESAFQFAVIAAVFDVPVTAETAGSKLAEAKATYKGCAASEAFPATGNPDAETRN